MSADNAHLLSDDDLRLAGNNLYAKVRRGGLLLMTLRDYAALLREKPTPSRVFDDGHRTAFPVWPGAARQRATGVSAPVSPYRVLR
jgi:hypothetical protein